MRQILAIAAILALSAGAAEAQYYGSRSGNTYQSFGGTTYGSNSRTGSTWSNSVTSGGNQHGIDSRGNSWNYNAGTGVYRNYGTGETRYRGNRW